jgi:Protein of unknown function (DUF3040)
MIRTDLGNSDPVISQDDQRRLDEIARAIRATDPRFADRLRRMKPAPRWRRGIACAAMWSAPVTLAIFGIWLLAVPVTAVVGAVTILMWQG